MNWDEGSFSPERALPVLLVPQFAQMVRERRGEKLDSCELGTQ